MKRQVLTECVLVFAGCLHFSAAATSAQTIVRSFAAGVLTALDPLDGTKLWTTQQWSNDAARCVWNTRIVEYEIVPQAGTAKQFKPKGGKRP